MISNSIKALRTLETSISLQIINYRWKSSHLRTLAKTRQFLGVEPPVFFFFFMSKYQNQIISKWRGLKYELLLLALNRSTINNFSYTQSVLRLEFADKFMCCPLKHSDLLLNVMLKVHYIDYSHGIGISSWSIYFCSHTYNVWVVALYIVLLSFFYRVW